MSRQKYFLFFLTGCEKSFRGEKPIKLSGKILLQIKNRLFNMDYIKKYERLLAIYDCPTEADSLNTRGKSRQFANIWKMRASIWLQCVENGKDIKFFAEKISVSLGQARTIDRRFSSKTGLEGLKKVKETSIFDDAFDELFGDNGLG